MPVIHEQDEQTPLFVSEASSNAEGVFTKRTGMRFAVIPASSTAAMDFVYNSPIDGMQVLSGTSSAEGFFRLNDEPNVFPSGSSAGSSAASLALRTSLDFPMGSNGSSNASFEFGIYGNSERDRLRVVLNVFPQITENRYREYKVKLTLDGVTLRIKSFSYTKSALSMTFSAVLADIKQRALVAAGGSFKLEIGTVRLGTITWKTIFDSAELEQSGHSVGWSNNSPTDTFSFSLLSSLSKKLNKTPLRDLVIYDGGRTKVDVTSYEPYYDTNGTRYTAELKNISGLKLHRILSEIFVNRCGFTGYVTNLPNVPLRRADFPIDNTFWESLKGYLGMYRLAIKEIGTEIYIVDKTVATPVGFPALITLTTSKVKSVQKTTRASRIEALRLHYTATETEALFPVERPDSKTNDLGNGLTEELDWVDLDWKSVNFPTLIVKTTRDTFQRSLYLDSTEVERYNERYTYDTAGRETQVTKEKRLYMPFINANNEIYPDGGYSLIKVEEEVTKTTYQSHPFVRNAIYISQVITEQTGKYATDPDNEYLGEAFQQAMIEAHRAGNLAAGMVIAEGRLKTFIKTLEPKKNGTVKPSYRVIDHLRRGIPVSPPDGETAGESALSVHGETTRKLIVKEYDSEVLSGLQIEDFHIGEMPLYIGLPLARRELKFRKHKLGSVTAEVLGLNFDYEDGVPVNVRFRDNEDAGNIMIDSVSINGNDLGTENEDIAMSVQGEPI